MRKSKLCTKNMTLGKPVSATKSSGPQTLKDFRTGSARFDTGSRDVPALGGSA